MKKILLLNIYLIFSALVSFAQVTDNSRMWAGVEIASQTAVFRINLPSEGCLSILTRVPGKKQIERLWGPRYMQKGIYQLKFPAGRVAGKNGSIELFTIDLKPTGSFGSRGSGERQFNMPMGLDIDRGRNELLIADTGNDRIVRVGFDGRFISQHGGFGISFGDRSEEREDSLDEPFDVACGGFSDFYISDQNNDRICIFDSYQSYRGTLFPPRNDRRNRLSRPRGIKIDSENNVWVVDGRADKVLKLTGSGDKLLEVGGFGYSTLQLKNPNQLDINLFGEIHIADRDNGRIAIFDRLGSYQREMRDHLKTPSGVAIDNDGIILVCDDSTNEMGLYTPAGIRIAFLKEDVDGSTFRRPSDIAVCDNHVFLLDSGNHRVVCFDRKKRGSSVPWQASDAVLE